MCISRKIMENKNKGRNAEVAENTAYQGIFVVTGELKCVFITEYAF